MKLFRLAASALAAAAAASAQSQNNCRNKSKTQYVNCAGSTCSQSYSGGCSSGSEYEESSRQTDCRGSGTSRTCYYDVVCCSSGGYGPPPTPRPVSGPSGTKSFGGDGEGEEETLTDYRAPSEVKSTHGLSRFGRTNDFGVLLDVAKNGGSWGNEQEEYIMGTTIGSIIVLAVAVVWFIVVSVFRCLGQRNVGFLAGWFQRPKSISGEGLGTDQAKKKVEDRFNCRVNSVRITFLACGGLLIISLILFYAKGIAAVGQSLNDVDYTLDWVASATEEARTSIRSILDRRDDLVKTSNDVKALTQSCSTLSVDGRAIVNSVNALRSTVAQVDELIGFFETADNSLAQFQERTDGSENSQSRNNAKIGFWVTVAVNTVMMVLVLWMCAQVIILAKWSCKCASVEDDDDVEKEEENHGCCKCCYHDSDERADGIGSEAKAGCCDKNCIRTTTNTLILPLFIVFLLLSWVFASLTLVAAIAGADFCVAPDSHIMSVVDSYKEDIGEDVYDHIEYYISGCARGDSPMDNLIYNFDSLVEDSESTFAEIESIGTSDVAAACGMSFQRASSLREDVLLLDGTADSMFRDFDGLRKVTDCKEVNQVYSRMVHDAICVNGVGGLTWVFATMLTMIIMANLLLTFRAALRPIKEVSKGDVTARGEKALDETPAEVGTEVPLETSVPLTDDNADETIGSVEEGATETHLPQPIPAPQAQPSNESEEPVTLERSVTTSVLADGTTQVTEVSMIRNPDGTITKKTQIRTQ